MPTHPLTALPPAATTPPPFGQPHHADLCPTHNLKDHHAVGDLASTPAPLPHQQPHPTSLPKQNWQQNWQQVQQWLPVRLPQRVGLAVWVPL